MWSLANPLKFMRFSERALPWISGLAGILLTVGFVWGLVFAPEDYQMGDTVRIMFVHVPSAWLAMFCYAVFGWCQRDGLHLAP